MDNVPLNYYYGIIFYYDCQHIFTYIAKCIKALSIIYVKQTILVNFLYLYMLVKKTKRSMIFRITDLFYLFIKLILSDFLR